MQFNQTKYGICQRARRKAGVDSTEWSTADIANSCNDWLDFIVMAGIGLDKGFAFDDINHAKLNEGTTPLVEGQTDYSFLTDEEGNPIVTLTGVSILVNGRYIPLQLVDRDNQDYDSSYFATETGQPSAYDKIADNIIRLDKKPEADLDAGLKYFFQRTGSYFDENSTTKQPGVSPLLHKGFYINAAYDIADTLGLPNLSSISRDRDIEIQKVKTYFSIRNNDNPKPKMTMKKIMYI